MDESKPATDPTEASNASAQTPASAAAAAKAQRLAKALRDNLKRRKAGARGSGSQAASN